MSETTKSKPALFLSKGLVIRGMMCHKSLYLHKYRPELRDELPDEAEMRFENGYRIGDLALELFPGGEMVPYDDISFSGQIEKTASLIREGCVTVYEASFFFNDVFVKADILHKGEDGWEIVEVKSSTGVKEYHILDAAVQYHVITGCGLPVSRVCVVHVNNEYVRAGDIDVKGLFHMEDITPVIQEKQADIIEEIRRQRIMLKGDEPAIDIGPHCGMFYPCDFEGHCWSHIPEQSVFDVRGRFDRRFDLYRSGTVSMFDVPREYLSWKQTLQIDMAETKGFHCNPDDVADFLDSLWYPLYFFDFETFMEPIPPYDGIRPYQQIPFQYSLHYLERKDGELKHHEFLAEPNADPRRNLIEKLIAEIPEQACILAYNKGFEITRLKDLAAWFPEYTEKIERMIENIRDLAAPFRQYSIYSFKQQGSYSLKYVLPAMVPDIGYDHLDIQNGGMAMDSYAAMNQNGNPDAIAKIRHDLLEYCKLDTLAMAKILERLYGVTSENGKIVR